MSDNEHMTAVKPSFDVRRMLPAILSGLAVVIALFLILFGQELLGLDREGVDQFLTGVQESPWSFFAVVILFVGLALVGFPQALLYAATVAVFGAWQGGLFAWSATMVSSAVTFGMGKFLGARWVNKISAKRAEELIEIVRERGLLASMIVRWLPTAPLVVVNSICGASGMAFWKFMTGTGLGVIPKLAFIAFFTDQLGAIARFLTSGDTSAIFAIILIAALWIGFFFFCRWLYGRLKTTSLAGLAGQTEIGQSSPAVEDETQTRLNAK
ncbi:VTT domain-containing protein [Parvularcula sp. ZS-1/3]|uniref:TVP38/TMEM64 family membrane protein n=1 Tax=Parvularcula mediterranea TaxID=2732508 RepID=A0A7Y3W651_9PROT|nr:VTT domain-containing protein [Parvularcula mediterranea]NNU17153.1 VTT domain-containing protein [Parvularcula mediterranea]